MARTSRLCVLALTLLISATAAAQAPYPSKVDLRFNHWYDYAEMTQALHDLVAAYPDLLTIQSLGKSVGGRDIWCVTLNNPKTGADTAKTAMFIDGNIHGNEIQAAEVVLYSIWYLTKSHGNIDKLTKLIDERSFYFVPMENPDGREIWFHDASNPHYLRGGIRPTDNDHDGMYDEDPPDDLDGDGHLTAMWKEDPLGRWKRNPDDDRFFMRVPPDKPPGGWTFLGQEGIDNDGDGDVNEDGPGGYDPNRNWPSDWQPDHVQGGAGDFPFSLPETRAVGAFVFAHPNIAGFQSYHNAGGMILRGPGADYVNYPGGDNRVFDAIGQEGAKLIPFYNYWIIWKDLYTVHGGEVNWAYEGLGILSFTNELWTEPRMFSSADATSGEHERRFVDLLQFEDTLVPYKEFEHPTYGTILVGGEKKYSSRVTPPWLLEEECHRNFAFTMFHADEMPKVEWGVHQVKQLSGIPGAGVTWEVTVEVRNPKIIPTILQIAAQKKIGQRDSLLCESATGAKVVASGRVESFFPWAQLEAADTPKPERIWNDRGIGTHGSAIFRFLIAGNGTVELTYQSQKGGTITRAMELVDTPMAVPDVED